MVSLVSIHVGALLFDVNHGHRVPSGPAVFTNSRGFVLVQVFLEPVTEGPLGLPNVCVG